MEENTNYSQNEDLAKLENLEQSLEEEILNRQKNQKSLKKIEEDILTQIKIIKQAKAKLEKLIQVRNQIK